jgi:hypothetical protein
MCPENNRLEIVPIFLRFRHSKFKFFKTLFARILFAPPPPPPKKRNLKISTLSSIHILLKKTYKKETNTVCIEYPVFGIKWENFLSNFANFLHLSLSAPVLNLLSFLNPFIYVTPNKLLVSSESGVT